MARDSPCPRRPQMILSTIRATSGIRCPPESESEQTVERVLAFKGIGPVAGVVVGIAIGAKHGVGVLFFRIIGAALGFFVADVWIRNLGERRPAEILKGLPDSLDMQIFGLWGLIVGDAAGARTRSGSRPGRTTSRTACTASCGPASAASPAISIVQPSADSASLCRPNRSWS
jgi:hypothetical protein